MARTDDIASTTSSAPTEAVIVDVLREGTTVVSALTGEIDAITAAAVQASLSDLITDSRTQLLVVDLSELSFLSSSGLRMLMDIAELADTRQVQLRVVTGSGRVVVRPLRITRLDAALSLFETRAEALRPGDS